MKLIAGLGNPGEKYKNTRHNAGFMAVDFLLNDGDGFMEARPGHDFKSDIFTLGGDGSKIILLKPQTYMNDSGQALKDICNFYKIDAADDLLVIHDDVDLPLGTVRLTASSSAAGHNGIKSIIENLGSQDFHRVRVGVETRSSRADMPTDRYVLCPFSEQEQAMLQQQVFPDVSRYVRDFLLGASQ